MLMRSFVAIALCMAVSFSAFASEGGVKVSYDGGSVPGLKAGDTVKLFTEQDHIRLKHGSTDVLNIPGTAVTEVSYGQDVHRRIGTAIGLAVFSLGIGALMMFSKSKKHFIGVTWEEAGHKGGMAFQADKGDYRGVLAGLEGVSGKKAVDSDAMTVKN